MATGTNENAGEAQRGWLSTVTLHECGCSINTNHVVALARWICLFYDNEYWTLPYHDTAQRREFFFTTFMHVVPGNDVIQLSIAFSLSEHSTLVQNT